MAEQQQATDFMEVVQAELQRLLQEGSRLAEKTGEFFAELPKQAGPYLDQSGEYLTKAQEVGAFYANFLYKEGGTYAEIFLEEGRNHTEFFWKQAQCLYANGGSMAEQYYVEGTKQAAVLLSSGSQMAAEVWQSASENAQPALDFAAEETKKLFNDPTNESTRHANNFLGWFAHFVTVKCPEYLKTAPLPKNISQVKALTSSDMFELIPLFAALVVMWFVLIHSLFICFNPDPAAKWRRRSQLLWKRCQAQESELEKLRPAKGADSASIAEPTSTPQKGKAKK